MRRMIESIAFTIAGCGLLAGSLTLDDWARLHDTIRARVTAEIGAEGASAEAVRRAFRGDPEFDRLAAYFRARTVQSVRHPGFAEDAVQEAFLKTWKGRPSVFLQDHDAVLRYLRVASRQNLLTMLKRDAGPGRLTRVAAADEEERADPSAADPAAGPALEDLVRTLSERLGPEEREALTLRLSGIDSERGLARATGASRHAIARVTENLRRELARLLDGGCGSAA